MIFQSILFGNNSAYAEKEADASEPLFFKDLNLDQVIKAITSGKTEYNLEPFFYIPLNSANDIIYRHEIIRDLENAELFESIKLFAERMKRVRLYLSMIEKLHYKYHYEGWFLEAVLVYCNAVTALETNLRDVKLKSEGLIAFNEFITGYTSSTDFKTLTAEALGLKRSLSSLKYSIIIRGDTVSVRKYEEEADYSMEVEKTFKKFQEGAGKDYTYRFSPPSGMNHVESNILKQVAKLYPGIFLCLGIFFSRKENFLNTSISTFDREIQFYVAYLEYISKMKKSGLKFCFPQIAVCDRDIWSFEGFDIALADKLVSEDLPVVCNDFTLSGGERVIVVSGPNQGGKTTFARAFGQIHYLASLGLPVPGDKARLFLFDNIFTHFEKEEKISNLRGKLHDDLFRVHDILNQAGPDSILLLNEIFMSTTLKDALFLSGRIMEIILQKGLICVWVTFIDELSSYSEKTVSMMSTALPESPETRTFRVIRKPADGLAYAMAIAGKYRLTYNQLKERL